MHISICRSDYTLSDGVATWLLSVGCKLSGSTCRCHTSRVLSTCVLVWLCLFFFSPLFVACVNLSCCVWNAQLDAKWPMSRPVRDQPPPTCLEALLPWFC